MSTYRDPPPLPRSPTILRRDAASLSAATAPSPPPPPPPLSPPPPLPARDLPLPPRFPSMTDVAAPWTTPDAPDPEPAEITDVAWKRAAPDLTPPPPADTDDIHPVFAPTAPAAADPLQDKPAEKDATPFVAALVAKVKALLAKRTKPAEHHAEHPVKPTPPAARDTKPPLVKAKELVCKLPDPTLLFVLESALILVLHLVRPHLLRTWPARIVTPLLLVPTVAATALWRPTRLISLKDVPEYTSAAKPIPNAGKVVSKGENLRARETAVRKAEEDLRHGQMRLEVLRKEIEGRLPPQVSIANLLEKENEAANANLQASPQ